MAEKIIITTDGGSKTIENINPAARNATLAQFGEKIADLTTNTYQKTDRITKVNCDTEPGGGTKATPTLTLDQTTISAATINAHTTAMNLCTATSNSDGHLYVRLTSTTLLAGMDGMTVFGLKNSQSVVAQTVYIGVTETDTYKGVEVAFEITT